MRFTAVQRWPEFLYEPCRRERRRLRRVGVLHHHERVVAAELEHHALVAGFGGDVLADRHAAGEGDQVGVRVGDHLVGDLLRVAGDTESICGGSPASYRMSARTSAASGVFSVGFSTMRLLVATAGATLWITWLSG